MTATVRVGAVDIGSNTVRMLVAEVEDGGDGRPTVTWRDRRATVTRLAQDVDSARRFDPDAVERTLSVLAGYGEAIAGWECRRVRAVATSAVRDVADHHTFLDRAGDALGWRPEVIGGEEEAALAFAGATSGVEAAGGAMVIDVGGGSTELVVGDRRPVTSVSVDIGSVRLTERRLPDHPASAQDVAGARRHVDAVLAGSVPVVTTGPPPPTVIGVAGTFTSLAAIDLGLARYDPSAVHGTPLAAATLTGLVERLAGLTIEETAAIPSLDPARAPVLLGGAIVAERVLDAVGATGVVVSEHDNLDGVAAGLAAG